LDNRSTITNTASFPSSLTRSPLTKSIPIDVHRPVGVSSGRSNPGGFPLLPFDRWQVWHVLT
ncbi:hypothetical protein PHMEG_00031815, partial [Phytophthora megakarya]